MTLIQILNIKLYFFKRDFKEYCFSNILQYLYNYVSFNLGNS
jgi:hypothetical protein